MLKQENENGERTAVGIDPCKEFLQLAILSHKKEPVYRKVPLLPSITAEIARSTDPENTQIAIESYGSNGKLFVFELMKRGYDIREVNPYVSNRLTDLFTEEHSDRRDAESLAKALFLLPDLPKVSFTERKLWLGKLSRLREKVIKDLNAYVNRLHVALTESYGVVYKSLFRSVFSEKALKFFESYPTINDTFSHKRKVKTLLAQEKWELLRQAGQWERSFYLELLGVEIRCLITVIRVLIDTKKKVERQIRDIGEEDKEMKILRSIPGVDYVTASSLLSGIGNVERFEQESSLASYCGVGPVLWQSGTSRIKTKRRKRFSRRLKGNLYLISLTQIRVNHESRAYYWRKRKEGKTHWQAMNALSRQLIKIIYYMLKNHECYQREKVMH
ncbi:MAG: IS110 family transposase [Candidatus Aminicenantes bacterium]|nr:IS110 family transposase [Candidatus Aminicenantes bacterium]